MRRAHLFVFVIIETESFHLMSAYFLEGFVDGMRTDSPFCPPPLLALTFRENRAPPCVKVQGFHGSPPDGWEEIPRWAGGWVLNQPPWSFGFDSQTRGTRENREPPCVKVPGASRVPTRGQRPATSCRRTAAASPHRRDASGAPSGH